MSTLTRRERREQERERHERRPNGPAPQRQRGGVGRLWVGIGVIVLLAVLLVGGRALGIFAPAPAALDINAAKFDAAGDVIGTHGADEGNAHVPAGEKVTYKTDPPTSGSHWGSPAAPAPWGVKDVALPNEVIIHNLEHGGIVIFYKDISPVELESLKTLVRQMGQSGFRKIILEPYNNLTDAHIAISAWRWSLKLPGYDEVPMVKFIRSHYESSEAPEPTVP